MKKLSIVERTLLECGDTKNYSTYRCKEHGIYQVKKDMPENEHCCIYCKKKHTELTDIEISDLLKS